MSTDALNDLQGNIVATFHAGAFFGALLTFPLAEKIGRKKSVLICSLVFLLGGVLMTAAKGHIGMIIAGRAIAGLGIGAVSLIVPVYIAETSPPSIRGRLIGLWEVCSQGGGMCGFWINYAVDRTISGSKSAQWMVPMGLQLLPGFLLFVGILFCPESPRWLVKQDRWEAAEKVLSYVRTLPIDDPYIRNEMAEIKRQVAERNAMKITKKEAARKLFAKGTRNRVGIGLILAACQNLMGTNIVSYYAPRIFGTLGISGTATQLFATGFYGFTKTLGVIIFSIYIAEKIGRRQGLIWGALLASFPMWYIGGYVFIADPTKAAANGVVTRNGWGYLAIVCIYVYAVILCSTWQGITWVYSSEIFPIDIRMLCVSLTIANGWLWSFVISKCTPYMITALGYGTYMFFAALLILMGIWAFFFVPETKGKFPIIYHESMNTDCQSGLTLEQMDRLFMKSMHEAVWDQLRNKGTRDSLPPPAAAKSDYVDEKDIGLVHIEMR